MQKTERMPMSDGERFQKLMDILDELSELSSDHILLVEGKKDCEALANLSVNGDFFQIQSSGGPVSAVEYVESHGGRCVILTDWDRRGNSLAEQIATLLGKDNHDVDLSVRAELSNLCRPFIKDVESLDSFVGMLSGKVYVR